MGICTSLMGCRYKSGSKPCKTCSHHVTFGYTIIDGREYTWDFNPRFGPLFECASIGKRDWVPNSRHKVWKAFEAWLKETQDD